MICLRILFGLLRYPPGNPPPSPFELLSTGTPPPPFAVAIHSCNGRVEGRGVLVDMGLIYVWSYHLACAVRSLHISGRPRIQEKYYSGWDELPYRGRVAMHGNCFLIWQVVPYLVRLSMYARSSHIWEEHPLTQRNTGHELDVLVCCVKQIQNTTHTKDKPQQTQFTAHEQQHFQH